MSLYFPDGSIQTRQHLCLCFEYVVENFVNCLSHPGIKIFSGNTEDSD